MLSLQVGHGSSECLPHVLRSACRQLVHVGQSLRTHRLELDHCLHLGGCLLGGFFGGCLGSWVSGMDWIHRWVG